MIKLFINRIIYVVVEGIDFKGIRVKSKEVIGIG